MPLVCNLFVVALRWGSVSPFLSLLRRMFWCLRLWFRCCLLISFFFWVCWWQPVTLQSWILEFLSSLPHRSLDLLCCFQSHSCWIPDLFPRVVHHHTVCCRIIQRHWQFLFLMFRLFSFFILVMSILFFAALMPGMFLIHVDSSNIIWLCFLSFGSFLISDAFSYRFAHFFQVLFLTFGSILLSSTSLLISTSCIETSSLTSRIFFAAAAPCSLSC